MDIIYLLLGGNTGNRIFYLQQAAEAISLQIGPIISASALYETAAWGNEAQPAFLNQVLRVHTDLTPAQLLQTTLAIERSAGRERTAHWAPRTLDIDILFYGDEVIDTPELKVPHPALHLRRFTLAPLAEVAPDLVHPVLHQDITALLQACPDMLNVQRLQTSAT